MKHSPPPQSRHQHLRIFLLFSSWKFILLSLALLTPSPSYDTSTSLILQSRQSGSKWALVERLCEKLTRWDAIYFVKAAERGYINEQEWAFGWGFVQVMSGLARGFFPSPLDEWWNLGLESWSNSLMSLGVWVFAGVISLIICWGEFRAGGAGASCS